VLQALRGVVMLVQLERQDHVVQLERREQQELRVKVVSLAKLEPVVPQDSPVHRVLLVQLEILVRLEYLVPQVLLERLVRQV
jgi:hypothetical protein